MFLALTAFFFGFAKMVAAQYGVIVNHYRMKGTVKASGCDLGIEGVRVAVICTDEGFSDTVRTVSAAGGDFSVSIPFKWELADRSFTIIAEDTDGRKNHGEFLSNLSYYRVRKEDLNAADDDGWDRYYDVTGPVEILMESKSDKPCD